MGKLTHLSGFERGEVEALSTQNTENNCIFELYNLFGKKLISMILTNNNLNYISLNDINEGAYIYKILINGAIAKTDKLIIIK